MIGLILYILWLIVKLLIRFICALMGLFLPFLEPSLGFTGDMLSGTLQTQDLIETLSMVCSSLWQSNEPQEQPRKRRRLCFSLSSAWFADDEDDRGPILNCKRRPCRGSNATKTKKNSHQFEDSFDKSSASMKQTRRTLERAISNGSLNCRQGNQRLNPLGLGEQGTVHEVHQKNDEDKSISNKMEEESSSTLQEVHVRQSVLASRHPVLTSLLNGKPQEDQGSVLSKSEEKPGNGDQCTHDNTTPTKKGVSKFASRYPLLVGLLQGTYQPNPSVSDVIPENDTNLKTDVNIIHKATYQDDVPTVIIQNDSLSAQQSIYKENILKSKPNIESKATSEDSVFADLLQQVYQTTQSQTTGILVRECSPSSEVLSEEHLSYVKQSLSSNGISNDSSMNMTSELDNEEESLPFPSGDSVFSEEPSSSPEITNDSSFKPPDVTTDMSSADVSGYDNEVSVNQTTETDTTEITKEKSVPEELTESLDNNFSYSPEETRLPWFAGVLRRASDLTNQFIDSLVLSSDKNKKRMKSVQTDQKSHRLSISDASSNLSDSWTSASDHLENPATRGQHQSDMSTGSPTSQVSCLTEKDNNIVEQPTEQEQLLPVNEHIKLSLKNDADVQNEPIGPNSSLYDDQEMSSLQWPEPDDENDDIYSSGQFEGEEEDLTNVSQLSSSVGRSYISHSSPLTDSGLDDISGQDNTNPSKRKYASPVHNSTTSMCVILSPVDVANPSQQAASPCNSTPGTPAREVSVLYAITGIPPSSLKEVDLPENGSTPADVKRDASSYGKPEQKSSDEKSTFVSRAPPTPRDMDSSRSGVLSPLVLFDVKRGFSASGRPDRSPPSKNLLSSFESDLPPTPLKEEVLIREDSNLLMTDVKKHIATALQSPLLPLSTYNPDTVTVRMPSVETNEPSVMEGNDSAPPAGQKQSHRAVPPSDIYVPTPHIQTETLSGGRKVDLPAPVLFTPPRVRLDKGSLLSTPAHTLMTNLTQLRERHLSSNQNIMDLTSRVVNAGLALARLTLSEHVSVIDRPETPPTSDGSISPPIWPETCIRDIYDFPSHSKSPNSEIELEESGESSIACPSAAPNTPMDSLCDISSMSWDVLSLADVDDLIESDAFSRRNSQDIDDNSPFTVIDGCVPEANKQFQKQEDHDSPKPPILSLEKNHSQIICFTPVAERNSVGRESTDVKNKIPMMVFMKPQSVGTASPFTDISFPKSHFHKLIRPNSQVSPIMSKQFRAFSEENRSKKTSPLAELYIPQDDSEKALKLDSDSKFVKPETKANEIIALTLQDQSVGENSPFLEICCSNKEDKSYKPILGIPKSPNCNFDNVQGINIVQKQEQSVLKEILHVYLYGENQEEKTASSDEAIANEAVPDSKIDEDNQRTEHLKHAGQISDPSSKLDKVPIDSVKFDQQVFTEKEDLPSTPSKRMKHRELVALCSPQKPKCSPKKPLGDDEDDWLYSPSVRQEATARRLSAVSITNTALEEDADLGVSILPKISPEDVKEPISEIISHHLWGAEVNGENKAAPETKKNSNEEDEEENKNEGCECRLCIGIEKIKENAKDIVKDISTIPRITLEHVSDGTELCTKSKRSKSWDLHMSPIACIPDNASLPIMKSDSCQDILQFTQNSTAPELPILDPLHCAMDKTLRRHQSCPSLRSLGCQASLNSMPWENCSIDSEAETSEMPFCSTMRDSCLPAADLSHPFITVSHVDQSESMPSLAGLTSPGKAVPALLNTTLNRRKRKFSFLKRFSPWFSDAPRSPLKVLPDTPQDSHHNETPSVLFQSQEETATEEKWYNKLFKSRKNKSTVKKQKRKLSFADTRQSKSMILEPNEPVYVVGFPSEIL